MSSLIHIWRTHTHRRIWRAQKHLSVIYFGMERWKWRTYLGFEVHFDLRLWTSGFCNLTAHYFSNHLFSLCLNVIFLHFSNPLSRMSHIFLVSFLDCLTRDPSLPVMVAWKCLHLFPYFRRFLSGRRQRLIQTRCRSIALPLHSGSDVATAVRKIKPLSFAQCANQDLTSLCWNDRWMGTMYFAKLCTTSRADMPRLGPPEQCALQKLSRMIKWMPHCQRCTSCNPFLLVIKFIYNQLGLPSAFWMLKCVRFYPLYKLPFI